MAKETNNKFEIMAESSGNLLTDAAYAADADRINGVVTGVARSILYNTALRQDSKIAVAIANFMARKNPLTDIDTALTTEQIDALLETAIKVAAASGPGNQVITFTYVGDGEFSVNIAPYVLNDTDKLTAKFVGTIPDADLDLPVKISVDGNATNYPVKVKDAGNEFLVRNTITEIADIFRDGSNVIINRTEPAEAKEKEYNLSKQVQSTIVPVEGSTFNDNKVVGESAIELVDNGDFDSLTGIVNTGLDLSLYPTEKIVGSNSLKIDGVLVSSNIVRLGVPIGSVVNGGKYFTSFFYKILTDIALTPNQFGIGLRDGSVTGLNISDIIFFNDWDTYISFEKLSTVLTAFEASSNAYLIMFMNTTTSGDWTAYEALVDALQLIPLLTAKQQALSLTDLNNKYPIYLNFGLQSVENPEIKVTNQNVLKLIPNRNILIDQGFAIVDENKIVCNSSEFWDAYQIYMTDTAIAIDETYTLSFIQTIFSGDNRRVDIVFFDENDNIIDSVTGSTTGTGFVETNFIIPIGTFWIDFRFARSTATAHNIEYTNVQINHGASALVYIKSDNSSKKYPLQTLRDLPNGVADYIDTINNVLHELVSDEYILQSGDITSLITTATNIDYIVIPRAAFNNIYNQTAGINTGKIIVLGYNIAQTTNLDVAGGTYLIHDSISVSGAVLLTFEKGKYADLAAAQSDLEGTVTQYELATLIPPVEIDPDGIAFAYKNMTIEIIQDNGFSNSWFAKHDLNYPATAHSLGKALQTAEKQITKLEDEKLNKSGDKMLGNLDMGFKALFNLVDPTAANHAATKAFMDKVIEHKSTYVVIKDQNGSEVLTVTNNAVTSSKPISLANTNKIINVVDPVDPQDAATKKYVDDATIVDYDKIPVSAAKYLSEDNITAQTGNGFGAVYSADGEKLYVLDSTNDTIYQYQTKTPYGKIDTFDNSKALGTSLGLRGLVMKEDGSKVIVSYINSTNIESFDLDTDYEISTLNIGTKVQKDVTGVAPGGVRDIAISKDGLKFYYLEDGSDDTITYATFSSALDLASLSDVNNFDGSSINTVLNGIAITETGGKMLVIGANDDKVFEIIMPVLFSFVNAVQGPDSNAIIEVSADSISIAYGSGVVLIADPAANTIARYMFATASRELTDALVSLAP